MPGTRAKLLSMLSSLSLGCLIFCVSTLAAAQQNYSLDDLDPTATKSMYSLSILKFLDHWPPPTLALKTFGPQTGDMILRAIKTPGHPHTIGLVKHSIVKVPFEKVTALMEDYPDYYKMWENVVSASILSKDGNRWITAWTRRRPAFFMPEIHYKMEVVIDKSVPGRAVYRQQFISGDSLYFSDGLVIVEKLGDQLTRISVLDFFNANFGPFRGLIEGVIWHRSLENAFKDDVAFRLKLEHPDWSVDKITNASEKMLDRHPVDPVQYTDLIRLK